LHVWVFVVESLTVRNICLTILENMANNSDLGIIPKRNESVLKTRLISLVQGGGIVDQGVLVKNRNLNLWKTAA